MLSWAASDSYPAFPRRAAVGTEEIKKGFQVDYGIDADAQAGADTIEDEDGLYRQFEKKKAKQIKADKIAFEDGKWYDMSLWRAMYCTVRRSFWTATIIEGAGCRFGSRPTKRS